MNFSHFITTGTPGHVRFYVVSKTSLKQIQTDAVINMLPLPSKAPAPSRRTRQTVARPPASAGGGSMKPGRDVQGGDSMNLGCDVQDASDRPVLPGDSGLSAISAHRAMAISLLVQEMRCEARVTGSVHVGVSSSHISEPLHPLAVARTAGRELAGSTTAWNDALELLAPPEAVLHVTVWSQAAASQCVLVASRNVRLRGLDTEDGGFADERISLFNDRGAKVWLRLAVSRRRSDIDLMCRGLRPTSPWVQLSPICAPAHVQDEPNDLAAPHSERRNGSGGMLKPVNAPPRKNFLDLQSPRNNPHYTPYPPR